MKLGSHSDSNREVRLPYGMTLEVDGSRKILHFCWGGKNHYLYVPRGMFLDEAVLRLKQRAYRHWTPPVPEHLRLSADNPRERPYVGDYSLRLHWFDVWSLDLVWQGVEMDSVLIGNRSLSAAISELHGRNHVDLFTRRIRRK